jgi:phage replication-related protein YjqB (UPF0714/DUF867 family)
MSPDKYKSYQSLKDSEQQDADYEILYSIRPSKYIVMAPHGGGIEPGTTEIAEAIAGDTFSFYSFSGTKEKGNRIFHIASDRFDEPGGLTLVKSSGTAVTVHGCEGNDQHVCLGGLNDELVEKIAVSLKKAGFPVEEEVRSHLAGKRPNNICNRSKEDKGVQIEISHGLRKLMFKGMNRRERKERTRKFDVFVQAIQDVLSNY